MENPVDEWVSSWNPAVFCMIWEGCFIKFGPLMPRCFKILFHQHWTSEKPGDLSLFQVDFFHPTFASRVAAIKARIRASIASIASQTVKLLRHFAVLVCICLYIVCVCKFVSLATIHVLLRHSCCSWSHYQPKIWSLYLRRHSKPCWFGNPNCPS